MASWLYLMLNGKYRSWKDFKEWGFLSAGHEVPDISSICQLEVGDRVYAYAPPHGYFASGLVTSSAVLPREFMVNGPFVFIQDGSDAGKSLPLDKIYLDRMLMGQDQDTDRAELIVGVDWRVVYKYRKARLLPGMQVPAIAAEGLIDSETRAYLEQEFNDAGALT